MRPAPRRPLPRTIGESFFGNAQKEKSRGTRTLISVGSAVARGKVALQQKRLCGCVVAPVKSDEPDAPTGCVRVKRRRRHFHCKNKEDFMPYMKAFSSLLMALLILSGCSNYSGRSYSGAEARTAQTVDYGTVVSVQEVSIEEDNAGTLGTLGGGVVGGVLGSLVGHGRGRTLATLGGALAGAGLGYAGTKAATTQTALEITVRLDSGQEISVVQGKDVMFAPGEKVRVLRRGSQARVTY